MNTQEWFPFLRVHYIGENMKWIKYCIHTTVEAEEIILASLMELGIEGVEIEDNQAISTEDLEAMFVDIGPEIPFDDGLAKLSFYLEESEDQDKVLQKVKVLLEDLKNHVDIGQGKIVDSITEDIDWINNWKQYFHQFCIDDVLVIPSWEEVEVVNQDKMVIQIDPGTAFGTGMHDTTQLCIKQLKKYLQGGETILDIGCGSGILGMLGLKFGANYSFGTDLDPCAIDATHENMAVNNISKSDYNVVTGNIISDKEIQDLVGYKKYGIVMANILTEVLVILTPVIKKTLVNGGLFITSGIINCNGKEETMKATLIENGFVIEEVTYQGEWVSITARI